MKCAKCGAERLSKPYEFPVLLLCEGASDAALFRELLRVRGAPQIHVQAAGDLGNGSGRDFFGKALQGASVGTGFEKIKHVIIATDNDDDQTVSFERVRDQIASTGKFPVPVAPGLRAEGSPSVTIVMVPPDAIIGSLESLIYLTAATVNAENAAVVEGFAAQTGVPLWSPQKQAKMKVRSFLACTHEAHPDIGLGYLWSQDAGHLVPLDHVAFDQLYNVLIALIHG
jgi:hypothetical protein